MTTTYQFSLLCLLTIIPQANAYRYPVWASLARDYLSVMASSVSSECAFSSAGITISKRRNRLQADIVEALQGLKCMIKRGILHLEHPTIRSEYTDEDIDLVGESGGNEHSGKAGGEDEVSWDSMLHDEDVCALDSVGDTDDDVFVQSLS